MRGIYIHVPFCVRKCSYCDFYSVAAADPPAVEDYCRLLVREMDLVRERDPGAARAGADTVYFGGGTPTVLGAERLSALLAAVRERFPIAPGAEITTEANPGTVSAGDFLRLREAGFTRASIGVQSFDPAVLATLGRIHAVEETREAYSAARAARFASVGIDLIFGIPGQGTADWTRDIERTATLLPDHVSTYALAPEPGTAIHTAIARGDIAMPDDETAAEMFESARRLLGGAGYRQYEISNFSRPGLFCRHNMKYWQRQEVVGLGPSAHGLLFPPDAPLGLRTSNPPSLGDYANRIAAGRLPWLDADPSTADDAWKESLIAGLRLAEGVEPDRIEEQYGPPPDAVREAVANAVRTGRLRREGSRLRLPADLFFVSNEVLAGLV